MSKKRAEKTQNSEPLNKKVNSKVATGKPKKAATKGSGTEAGTATPTEAASRTTTNSEKAVDALTMGMKPKSFYGTVPQEKSAKRLNADLVGNTMIEIRLKKIPEETIKRLRGRPKKVSDIPEKGTSPAISLKEATNPLVKRRGRPKKETNVTSSQKESTQPKRKRGPGRPRKVQVPLADFLENEGATQSDDEPCLPSTITAVNTNASFMSKSREEKDSSFLTISVKSEKECEGQEADANEKSFDDTEVELEQRKARHSAPRVENLGPDLGDDFGSGIGCKTNATWTDQSSEMTIQRSQHYSPQSQIDPGSQPYSPTAALNYDSTESNIRSAENINTSESEPYSPKTPPELKDSSEVESSSEVKLDNCGSQSHGLTSPLRLSDDRSDSNSTTYSDADALLDLQSALENPIGGKTSTQNRIHSDLNEALSESFNISDCEIVAAVISRKNYSLDFNRTYSPTASSSTPATTTTSKNESSCMITPPPPLDFSQYLKDPPHTDAVATSTELAPPTETSSSLIAAEPNYIERCPVSDVTAHRNIANLCKDQVQFDSSIIHNSTALSSAPPQIIEAAQIHSVLNTVHVPSLEELARKHNDLSFSFSKLPLRPVVPQPGTPGAFHHLPNPRQRQIRNREGKNPQEAFDDIQTLTSICQENAPRQVVLPPGIKETFRKPRIPPLPKPRQLQQARKEKIAMPLEPSAKVPPIPKPRGQQNVRREPSVEELLESADSVLDISNPEDFYFDTPASKSVVQHSPAQVPHKTRKIGSKKTKDRDVAVQTSIAGASLTTEPRKRKSGEHRNGINSETYTITAAASTAESTDSLMSAVSSSTPSEPLSNTAQEKEKKTSKRAAILNSWESMETIVFGAVRTERYLTLPEARDTARALIAEMKRAELDPFEVLKLFENVSESKIMEVVKALLSACNTESSTDTIDTLESDSDTDDTLLPNQESGVNLQVSDGSIEDEDEEDEAFKLVATSRKTKHGKFGYYLVADGYLFTIDKVYESKVKPGEGTINWRCSRYRKFKCLVRISSNLRVDQFRYTHITSGHSHPAEENEILRKEFLNGCKSAAVDTFAKPRTIFDQESEKRNNPNIKDIVRNYPTIARAINRVRNRIDNFPDQGKKLADIELPDKYKVLANNERFLMYDSGKESGDDRLFIFSTELNLAMLKQENTWYADGTFKCTPQGFYQVYTIHAFVQEQSVPLLFALMPNKEAKGYKILLTKMKQWQNNYEPREIMTDFETGMIKAINDVYKTTHHLGCFFHFIQSCTKRITKIGGDVLKRFNKEEGFACSLKHLMALALVPKEKVHEYFDIIIAENLIPDQANEFVQYFEKYYIGRPDDDRPGRRKDPVFKLSLWNCHQLAAEERPKTNNAMEGWHHSFHEQFQYTHPNIFKFIKAIKTHTAGNYNRIAHRMVHGPDNNRRKSQLVRDSKLAKAVAALPEILPLNGLSRQNRELAEQQNRTNILKYIRRLTYYIGVRRRKRALPNQSDVSLDRSRNLSIR